MKHFVRAILFVFVVILSFSFLNCSPRFTSLMPTGYSGAASTSGSTVIGAGATSTPGSTGFFPAGSIWNQDYSSAALDPNSSSMIAALQGIGGWGTGSMRVDFSINILYMTAATPMVSFIQQGGYTLPDCDGTITKFPMPAGGAVEGELGYTCTGGGDCHMLVVDSANQKLYESYGMTTSGSALTSACAIVWDLSKIYPTNGRGDQCTSTDAAGYPVAPLLFTADEIAAGSINHAIRFILPNDRIAANTYVHPATHGGARSASAAFPAYGAHFRLKSTFNLSSLKPAAQVVARAMQKYGMFLADGGNIALTAANDAYTKAKWATVGFGSNDLSSIQVTDFEILDGGPRIPLTFDCVRNSYP